MAGRIYVICGPTAGGKTAAAIEVCRQMNGEVISADSMQVYRGFRVLAAKPDETEMQGIRHHLLDIVDPWEKYNASRFRADADRVIRDILNREKLPIVCGGTGLYIDALTKGMRMSEEADEKLRSCLKAIAAETDGPERLHKELEKLDSEAAKKYPAGDVRRVIRSLEINYLSGKTRAEQEAEDRQIPDRYDAQLYAIHWDRNELYRRIDERVERMMKDGLKEEVETILKQSKAVQETAAQAIGFKEIRSALMGEITMEQAIEQVKINTHHLAKRQETWLRRDPRTVWIDANASISPGQQIIQLILEDRQQHGC